MGKQAEGMTNVSVQVTKTESAMIGKLAAESGISKSEYLRRVIKPVLKKHGVFDTTLILKESDLEDSND